MGASLRIVAPCRRKKFPGSDGFLPVLPFEVASEQIKEVRFLVTLNRTGLLVSAKFRVEKEGGFRNRWIASRACAGKFPAQLRTAT